MFLFDLLLCEQLGYKLETIYSEHFITNIVMYAQTRRHVFWSLFGILLDVWYWYWLLFVMITFLVMISSTPSQSHKTSPKSLCMTLWLSNSCASDNLGFNLSQVRGNFNSFTGYRKYKQGWRKKWRNHLWKGSKSPVKKITCRKNHL